MVTHGVARVEAHPHPGPLQLQARGVGQEAAGHLPDVGLRVATTQAALLYGYSGILLCTS